VAADFLIVCKSWRGDLRRVARLLDSAERYNAERIGIVVCVPQEDTALFRDALGHGRCEFIEDEAVVAAHPEAARRDLPARLAATPGRIAQQVVKSEVWRLLGCDAYLCADSDTVFLRPFGRRDFLAPAGHPYTLLHQSREYLQLATNRGYPKVVEHFLAESERVKSQFGRDGPHYDFGPQPLLWSARVWHDLHERWLAPRGMTLWDAIDLAPTEIRWYGEALLALRSIPIDPVEPLFRVYHHDWQHAAMRRLGETEATVAQHYIGVVYQSNWEYELDAAGTRTAASRAVRRIKRWLRQARG